MSKREKVQEKGGGREGVEGGHAGEKFTSTLDWSRKSCNLAAARKQKQMSHVSHISIPLSLSIFLPSLPLILHTGWPVSFFLSLSLPPSFSSILLLSISYVSSVSFFTSLPSLCPHLSLSPPHSLSLCVWHCLTRAQSRL